MAKSVTFEGDNDWLTFQDPEDPDQLWNVHIQFMYSNWSCLFGRGCPGLFGEADKEYDNSCGCCREGAYFEDRADLKRTEERVARLTPEDMGGQKAYNYIQRKGWLHTIRDHHDPDDDNEGLEAKTKIRDGACVFQTRPDEAEGKIGCAFLHQAIREQGLSMSEVDHTKVMPTVCWQLPITVGYRYDEELDKIVADLKPWDVDKWGTKDEDGTHDSAIKWWCVAEGSEVVTERGLVPIENVGKNDRVLTRAGYRQVRARYANGYRPVVEVVHEGGSLFVTEDHEVLTQRGWVRAGQLAVAGSTDAVSSTGSDVGVLGRVGVPVGATTGPHGEGLASEDVLSTRATDQMPEVDAQSVSAEVVQFPTDENLSVDLPPDVNGGAREASVAVDGSVSAAGTALPGDALVSIDQVIADIPGLAGTVVPGVVTRDAAGRTLSDGSRAIETGVGVHGYTVLQVREVEGHRYVYDLAVEGQHEFVADGVVVHNCVDSPEAYIGINPVYKSLEKELRATMGNEAYEILREKLDERAGNQYPPIQSAVTNGGRPLLPLMVGNRTPKHPSLPGLPEEVNNR